MSGTILNLEGISIQKDGVAVMSSPKTINFATGGDFNVEESPAETLKVTVPNRKQLFTVGCVGVTNAIAGGTTRYFAPLINTPNASGWRYFINDSYYIRYLTFGGISEDQQRSATVTLRKNSVSTSMVATINPTTLAWEVDTDTTNTVSVISGDWIDFMVVVSGDANGSIAIGYSISIQMELQ